MTILRPAPRSPPFSTVWAKPPLPLNSPLAPDLIATAIVLQSNPAPPLLPAPRGGNDSACFTHTPPLPDISNRTSTNFNRTYSMATNPPPTILTYAREGRMPFPSRLLFALPIGPVAFLIIWPICDAQGYRLIPTPPWVEYLITAIPFFLLVSIIIAIMCLWLHKSSTRQRVFVASLSIATILLSVFLYLSIFGVKYRTPYSAYFGTATRMAKSSHIYALNHNGRYPPHLAAILLDGNFFARQLTDDDTVTTPAAIPYPPPLTDDWHKYAADVDAHTIFVYTAADLADPALAAGGTSSLDARIIMAYTKTLPQVPHHRVVAFVDGTPRLIPDSALLAAFAASNAARAKLGLPPFTLDGPPPLPPK